jgi:hypothetical protein
VGEGGDDRWGGEERRGESVLGVVERDREGCKYTQGTDGGGNGKGSHHAFQRIMFSTVTRAQIRDQTFKLKLKFESKF